MKNNGFIDPMNTNQRVGLVYRIIEDAKREDALSPLDIKNLSHYAETGEWLDDTIRKFEDFMYNDEVLEKFLNYAESAGAFLKFAEEESEILRPKFPYQGIDIDEIVRRIYCARDEKIRLGKELASLRHDEFKIREELSKNHEYIKTYGTLKKSLQELEKSDKSRVLVFQTEDGKFYSCQIERIGSKLIIRPNKEVVIE